MSSELLSIPGLILVAGLGLRHGLDPDHLSAVDGMTLRALEHHPRLAPWVGTLFALGHGSVVTAIAVGVSLLSHDVQLPAAATVLGEWGAIALLLLLGTLNLRSLLRRAPYQMVGWRSRFLPSRLRESSHPFAIVLVGILFGLVFDTATQATAWGLAATASGGFLVALAVGVLFTLGMMVTDSVDSHLMNRLMKEAGRLEAERYRRFVGWVVVGLSYGMAAYGLTRHLRPQAELSEAAALVMGLSLVVGLWLANMSLTGKLQANFSEAPQQKL